jgi:hypothetical protein
MKCFACKRREADIGATYFALTARGAQMLESVGGTPEFGMCAQCALACGLEGIKMLEARSLELELLSTAEPLKN